MKKYLLMLAVASAFTFTSCGDDDDDVTVTPAPTKTELITNKNWKVTAFTVTSGGTTSDFYALMDPCSKDDITRFTADMKVTFDEGPTKCDPSDPQSTTETWAFTTNESKLKITYSGGGSEEYTIDELLATSLKLSATSMDTVGGVPISSKLNITFMPQ